MNLTSDAVPEGARHLRLYENSQRPQTAIQTEFHVMPEEHLVTYSGMPRYAHTLVECLEAEGVQVSWTPPVEDRGGVAEVLGSVVAAIAVNGPETAVHAGVDRFRSGFPGKGRVQVEQYDAA